MEKWRRIFAMAGVVLLVFMYVMTLVTAILSTPESNSWFMASIGATIIVPIFLYAYNMIYRLLKQQNEDMKTREDAFLRQMEQEMKEKEAAEQKESEDIK